MVNSKNSEMIKGEHLKIGNKLKNEKTNKYKAYRIVSKILEINEINQYVNAMTKPLPLGCIKKQKNLSRFTRI